MIHEIPHLLELPELPERSEHRRPAPKAGHPRKEHFSSVCLDIYGNRSGWRPCCAPSIGRAPRRTSRCWWRAISFRAIWKDRSNRCSRAERIFRVGYTPERDFWLHAAAVDACINLRYPAAGETSGITIRLMGIAKPVLMSAALENAGFPECKLPARGCRAGRRRPCWWNS